MVGEQTDPTHLYRSTPRRIALDVVDVLATCPAVSRVAVFGSLAEDAHDGYSDVDVLCEVAGADGAWQAAAAVHAAMPLRWHGCFGGVPAPSGRHWLVGESIFHCVDLGYDAPAEFERKLREGVRGFPVSADVQVRREGVASGGRPSLPQMTDDYDFTHALHMATKAMKDYLRARGSWDAVAASMAGLEAAERGLDRRPRGGDPGGLVQDARTLYAHLTMERVRYGGAG